MLITNELIKSLDPCEDRLDNYLKFYKGKKHTKAQFMGLKNITHEDKIWVSLRLMSYENLKLAAADIAESVLHTFEEKYPNDKRPRLAIEAARSQDPKAAYAAADAAFYAAHCAATNISTADASSAYAAYAAANAAANVSDSAEAVYSFNAAYYVVAYYTAKATDNRLAQEKLIRKIILKYWR